MYLFFCFETGSLCSPGWSQLTSLLLIFLGAGITGTDHRISEQLKLGWLASFLQMLYIYFFIFMSVLPAHVPAWHPLRPEEHTRCPGSGVADGCKLALQCWGTSLGPLESQLVLTVEPPLQPSG